MLEKTEGAIQNGESRGMDIIGHKTQKEDKTKTHNTEIRKMSNADPAKEKRGWTQVVAKDKNKDTS